MMEEEDWYTDVEEKRLAYLKARTCFYAWKMFAFAFAGSPRPCVIAPW